MKVRQGLPISIFKDFLVKNGNSYSIVPIELSTMVKGKEVISEEFFYYNNCYQHLEEYID